MAKKGKAKANASAGSKKKPAAALASSGGLTWGESSLPCVATYKILEGEEFMDEFEDVDHPFPGASSVKMSQLWYYMQTTGNPAALDLLARQRTLDFFGYLNDVYGVTMKDPKEKPSDTKKRFVDIFKNGDKTLLDLARAVDQTVDFPAQ